MKLKAHTDAIKARQAANRAKKARRDQLIKQRREQKRKGNA